MHVIFWDADMFFIMWDGLLFRLDDLLLEWWALATYLVIISEKALHYWARALEL